ncbi:uncharacterized protein EI90DRAFT_3031946 [Cantharellus anzutake]|uniref:uncharacterized protein n=1 Tax=Cantharellus anzutake TaxID=1750568 RepID=UPI001905613E|nr:uncharacterized protein EI90DRAFT_3031946 [Cantharellus anzutake]KAF8342044.1 hypothetical protein EI90DRAFT_3031946 [Cantharellus anzutake]
MRFTSSLILLGTFSAVRFAVADFTYSNLVCDVEGGGFYNSSLIMPSKVSTCNNAWDYSYNQTISNAEPNPTASICGGKVVIHKKSLTWSSGRDHGKCHKAGKKSKGKECNPKGVAICTWTEEIECSSKLCK